MSKKSTKQEKFIARLISVHGSKYNYSLVDYIDSTTKIQIICPIHGLFTQRAGDHRNGSGCRECSKITKIETNLKKYGTAHPRQNKDVIAKQKLTCLTKYGVDNPAKSKIIQERTQTTNLERYGVTCTAQSKDSKIKIKNTMLERYGVEHYTNRTKALTTNLDRYGVEHAAQNSIIKKKTHLTNLERYGCHPRQTDKIKQLQKDTCLERYGVEFAAQSSEVRAKITQSNLERYGCHPSQTLGVREQVKQSCRVKYGVDNPRKSSTIKEQIKQTNINRYGVPNFSQRHLIESLPLINNYEWMTNEYVVLEKSAMQIAAEVGMRDTAIGRYLKSHNIPIRYTTGHSYKCLRWLESIMVRENIHIQHAQNEGEFKIPGTNWKADGYSVKTNTIYEFHGDYWHGNPQLYAPEIINESLHKPMGELYQQTITRENKLKELGYNLIVMWESEFSQS